MDILNVEDEFEDILQIYCKQNIQHGGLSKHAWNTAVTILNITVNY